MLGEPSRTSYPLNMKMMVFLALTTMAVAPGVTAQTRSAHDTATAYGARLDAKGQPADSNQRRVNNRVQSRIDSRLALRIERYRIGDTNDPTNAYRTQQSDKSRIAPVITSPTPQDDTGD